jgi:hypothetical protein
MMWWVKGVGGWIWKNINKIKLIIFCYKSSTQQNIKMNTRLCSSKFSKILLSWNSSEIIRQKVHINKWIRSSRNFSKHLNDIKENLIQWSITMFLILQRCQFSLNAPIKLVFTLTWKDKNAKMKKHWQIIRW